MEGVLSSREEMLRRCHERGGTPEELLERGVRLVFERHAARGMTLMPSRLLCRGCCG
jgi:hypothetical protein